MENVQKHLGKMLAAMIIFTGLVTSVVITSKWLVPSGSDLRMEYELVSLFGTTKYPKEAIDNFMPQVGSFAYWSGGRLAQLAGKWASYLWRYLVFLGALLSLYVAHKKAGFNQYLFWLLLVPSFFFITKYFYVVDFLLAIFVCSFLVYLIQRQSNRGVLFLVSLFGCYLKVSSPLITFVLMTVYVPLRLWRKALLPLVCSIACGLVIFLGLRPGLESLAHRGTLWFEMPFTLLLSTIKNLTAPWVFLETFDIQTQAFVSSLGVWSYLKIIFFLWVITEMRKRNQTQWILLLSGVVSATLVSLIVLRDLPTVHDFNAYTGVIYFALCGFVWSVEKYFDAKKRKILFGLCFIFFVGDLGGWWQAFQNLRIEDTKIEMGQVIKELQRERNVVFFCRDNVAEFEFQLDEKRIHYALHEKDFKEEWRPALLVIPERCLHFASSTQTKEWLKRLASSSRPVRGFNLSRYEIYSLYEY